MKHIRSGIAALAFLGLTGAASAVTVLATNGSLTDLGTFAAGTYQLTTTGIVDLVGDGSFPIDPNGKPAPLVTNPSYSAQFNPNGSFTADGNFGPAGGNAKFGALAGTLNPTAATGPNPSPAAAADFFLIGTSKTLTLASAGHIYGLVNDTYYPNNTGSFNVTISAVPEPAQAALLLAGLGVVGMVGRRRTRKD